MTFASLTKKNSGDPAPGADEQNLVGANFQASLPALIQAKGDLLPGSGAIAAARVAVGADGAYLFAESEKTGGVFWSKIGHALAPSTQAYQGMTLYNNTWSTSIVTGYPYWNTETIDPAGAWSTAADTYTAPHSGLYLVYLMGAVRPSTVGPQNWAVNNQVKWAIYVNGQIYSVVTGQYMQNAAHFTAICRGGDLVPLNGGDTLTVYIYRSSSSDIYRYQNSGGNKLVIAPIFAY